MDHFSRELQPDRNVLRVTGEIEEVRQVMVDSIDKVLGEPRGMRTPRLSLPACDALDVCQVVGEATTLRLWCGASGTAYTNPKP